MPQMSTTGFSCSMWLSVCGMPAKSCSVKSIAASPTDTGIAGDVPCVHLMQLFRWKFSCGNPKQSVDSSDFGRNRAMPFVDVSSDASRLDANRATSANAVTATAPRGRLRNEPGMARTQTRARTQTDFEVGHAFLRPAHLKRAFWPFCEIQAPAVRF